MIKFKLCKQYNQVEIEFDSVESVDQEAIDYIYACLPDYDSANMAQTQAQAPIKQFVPVSDGQRKALKWMFKLSDEEINNISKSEAVEMMHEWNANKNNR